MNFKIFSIIVLILCFGCSQTMLSPAPERVISSIHDRSISSLSNASNEQIKINPKQSEFRLGWRETADENLLLKEKQVISLMQKQDYKGLRNKFIEFAKEANVSYKEIDGGFEILPDKDGSKLNKFVASVNKVKSDQFGEIKFVFLPECMNRGEFDPDLMRVVISLESVFMGEPTTTELHEIVHLNYEYQFWKGKSALLKYMITPGESASFIGDGTQNYSGGFVGDELLTHSGDLRRMRRFLKESQGFSKEAREHLFWEIKDAVEVLGDLTTMTDNEINSTITALKKKANDEVKFELRTFSNGRDYIRIHYFSPDRFLYMWNDSASIELAKKYASTNNASSKTKIAKSLKALFVERIKNLKNLNDELKVIVADLKKLSLAPDGLTSQAFYDKVDEFRSAISDHEELVE
jgi:hypothetical protein